MDFGAAMFFTEYSMTPARLAQALEARGFELVWAPEHSHIPASRATPFPQGGELPKKYSEAMDPFVSLTAAAVATKTLKVGTGVCLVAQRDPIQTAKLVASIDQVSGGRFLFGIGGGWNAEEMADHGTEFKTRFKLMRERIEAMKEIWTKPEAEYHGEIVDFPPMMAWPKPVQKPHPPVIVGGAFPHAARRALALWRRLDPARQPAAIWRRHRVPAAVSADGGRSRARSRFGSGHGLGRPEESRPPEALPRFGMSRASSSACRRPAQTRSCRSSTAGLG